MNTLSILSLMATAVFVGLGAVALRRDARSPLNRVFTALCMAYAIWSFGFAFLYSAPSKEACWGWDRVASLGWTFAPALALHASIVLSRRQRWLTGPWSFVLLYLPGLVMFVRYQLLELGVDVDYQRLPLGWAPQLDAVITWFWFYEAYLVTFIAVALYVLVTWARTATLTRERRQAWALSLSCLVALLVGLSVDMAGESLLDTQLPPMAPILGVVWAAGVAYAMTRHRLMVLSPALASGQILESVRDLLLLVDRDEQIVDANQQALSQLGYERDELVGESLGRVFGSEETARRALRSTRGAAAAAFPLELTWLRKDGRELPIWLWGSPILDADEDWIGAVLVGRDLSEQRRMEDELVRASGVESIGLLAGGVAHDFNNLMAGVLGNLELAREAANDNPRVRARLDEAERAADQARQLAQRLLSFYRGQSPSRSNVDLGRLAKEASPVALRGSSVRLQIEVQPDLRLVRADEGQLTQVLHNLLINARQAMPSGGVVTVTARNLAAGESPPVGPPGLPPGDYVCLTVSDDGTGIPPEVLSRLFQPFFTTKEGGSGLGLASSRSIARRHGGDIVVESPPGGGATFRVYLPVA